MNLGEFALKIGITGDTSKLKEFIDKTSRAEKEIKKLIKREKELAKAQTEEEKARLKKLYALEDEREAKQDLLKQTESSNAALKKSIMFGLKFTTAIAGTITALDRLGNALFKSNQAYISFNQQTGVSIEHLNQLSTVAQLSNMNLSPQQVMNDLQSLQQNALRLKMGMGGNASAYTMLGFDPTNMNPEQIFLGLRDRLKGKSAAQQTLLLDELGINREYISLLQLSDEEFNQMLKKSRQLNLSEEERNELSKLTQKQQEKNLVFQASSQRLLIKIMPVVQNITDSVGLIYKTIADNADLLFGWLKPFEWLLDIIIRVVNFCVKLENIALKLIRNPLMQMLRDIADSWKNLLNTWKSGNATGIGWLDKILKGIVDGGEGIRDALKYVEDNINEMNDDLKEVISPLDTTAQQVNRVLNSNITNNFFNNPQPAGQISSQMGTLIDQIILRTQH